MPQITLILGILLVLLGVAFYIGTAMASPTALIPTIFGIVFAVSALLAISRPTWRKHMMHVAVAVALLGVLATAPMLVLLTLRGGAFDASAWEQLVMLVLCLAYVGLGVKSFIDARRRQGPAT